MYRLQAAMQFYTHQFSSECIQVGHSRAKLCTSFMSKLVKLADCTPSTPATPAVIFLCKAPMYI